MFNVASAFFHLPGVRILALTPAALLVAAALPAAANPLINQTISTLPVYFFVDLPQTDTYAPGAAGTTITPDDLTYLMELKEQLIIGMENLDVSDLHRGEGGLPEDQRYLVVSMELLFHPDRGISVSVRLDDTGTQEEPDWPYGIPLADDGDLRDHIQQIRQELKHVVHPAIATHRARAAGVKILIADCIRPFFGDSARMEQLSRYLTVRYGTELQQSSLRTSYWVKGVDLSSFDRLCMNEGEEDYPFRRASDVMVTGMLDDHGSEQEVTITWVDAERQVPPKRVPLPTSHAREALKVVVSGVIELSGVE